MPVNAPPDAYRNRSEMVSPKFPYDEPNLCTRSLGVIQFNVQKAGAPSVGATLSEGGFFYEQGTVYAGLNGNRA